MAFPQVASVTASSQSPNSTTSTVTLPGTFSAGDLFIGIVAADSGAGAMTWPAGWTEILDSAGTGFQLSIAYRIAQAGDTAPGVTHTTERSNHLLIRITGWHGTTAPEITTMATGSSTAPNSASLSPSWGTEDTLWITVAASDDSVAHTYTGFPYASNNNENGTATSAARVAMATTESAAASVDPGAFTISASETWGAVTIAVRPAASGAQSITLGLLDAAAALYAPTLTPKNLISLGLLDAGSALYAPTLTPKNLITLGLLDAGATLYAPTIIATQIITLGLLDAGAALYAPTLTPKNLITLGLLDAGAALYAPTLSTQNLITLGLLDAGAALYAPTLTPKNLITLGLLDAGAALYAPTIGQFTQVTLPLLDASATLYAPTLSTINGIVVPLLDAGAALYAPSLTGVNLVVLPLLDAGPALYAPSFSFPGLLILLPLLESAPELYAPLLERLGTDPAERLALGILRQEFWPQGRVNRDHRILRGG